MKRGTRFSKPVWKKISSGTMKLTLKDMDTPTMKNVKLTLLAGLTSALVGCAGTPDAVAPVEFSNAHSYAYNIASQTALTRDHSPLRDFTQAEVDEAKTKLTEKNAGDLPIFTGSIFMAMGNLISIIDVAGGAMANLAEQPHEASQSRWIIAVPVEQFASEKQAEKYILDSIHAAAKTTLAKYGEVAEFVVESNPAATVTKVTTAQGSYPIGLVRQTDSKDKALLTRTTFPFHGELKEVYAYGFNQYDRVTKNLLIGAPNPAFLATEYKGIKLTEFNQELTKELPYGFFLYTPSFPRFAGNGQNFTYPSEIVPAIYAQGEKYDFIQPTAK